MEEEKGEREREGVGHQGYKRCMGSTHVFILCFIFSDHSPYPSSVLSLLHSLSSLFLSHSFAESFCLFLILIFSLNFFGLSFIILFLIVYVIRKRSPTFSLPLLLLSFSPYEESAAVLSLHSIPSFFEPVNRFQNSHSQSLFEEKGEKREEKRKKSGRGKIR